MFEDMRGASEYEADEWATPEPRFTMKEILMMDIVNLLESFYE